MKGYHEDQEKIFPKNELNKISRILVITKSINNLGSNFAMIRSDTRVSLPSILTVLICESGYLLKVTLFFCASQPEMYTDQKEHCLT